MLGILVMVIGVSPHGYLVEKPNHSLCAEPMASAPLIAQPVPQLVDAPVAPVYPAVAAPVYPVPVSPQQVYFYRPLFRSVIRRGQFSVSPCTSGGCR